MSLIALTLLLLVYSISTSNSNYQLESCTSFIAKTYFETGKLLLLASSKQANTELFKTLTNSIIWPTVTLLTDYHFKIVPLGDKVELISSNITVQPTPSKIIPLNTSIPAVSISHKVRKSPGLAEHVLVILKREKLVENLQEVIASSRNLRVWNSRARFVIVLSDISTKDVVKKVLKTLWDVRVFNAVVLVDRDLEGVEVWSWFPYGKGVCGQSVEPVVLDRWLRGRFLNGRNIFPEKIRFYEGCVLIGASFAIPPFVLEDLATGSEVTLWKTIAQTLKARLEIITPEPGARWGTDSPNGTATGARGLVKRHEADIGFGNFRSFEETFNSYDVTIDYAEHHLVWIVSKARRIEQWLSLIIPFTPKLWGLLAVTHLATNVVMYLLTRSILGRNKSGAIHTFLYGFAVQLGVSYNPYRYVSRLRPFINLWVFYCIIISIAYQSSLVTVMTTPHYETQITDVEGAIKAGLPFCGHPRFREGFEDSSNWLDKYISEHFLDCMYLEQGLDMICNHRNVVTLATNTHAWFYSLDHRGVDGQSLLYQIKKPVATFNVVGYLSKDHPLRDRVNRILAGLLQGGFVNLYERNLMERLAVNVSRLEVTHSGHSALNFHHLQGAFRLLGIGLVMSGMAFVLEFWWSCLGWNLK